MRPTFEIEQQHCLSLFTAELVECRVELRSSFRGFRILIGRPQTGNEISRQFDHVSITPYCIECMSPNCNRHPSRKFFRLATFAEAFPDAVSYTHLTLPTSDLV